MYEQIENYIYNDHTASFYNDAEEFMIEKKELFDSIIGREIKKFWISWYTGAFDVKDTINEVAIEMQDGRRFILMGRYHDCFAFDPFTIDYDFSTGTNSKGEKVRMLYPWRSASTMRPSVLEKIEPIYGTDEDGEVIFYGVEITTKIQTMKVKNRYEALDVKVVPRKKQTDENE